MAFTSTQNTDTDFTKIIHRKPYPTISTSRPELDQAGKTVLVTGGATGIGFGIVQSFIKAGAQTVIVIGRRGDVLEAAATKLRTQAAGKTAVIVQKCDQADPKSVQQLWAGLKTQGILVDVLVLNAASFSQEKPLLELGAEETWNAFEVNVRGPLLMTEGFCKQNEKKRKVILNVSTQAINMLYESQLAPSDARPSYGLTKNAGTLLIQQIAKDATPDQLQVISFHPGLIYNDEWNRMGVKEIDLPFDDAELPGSFAVWATTLEASFLQGRFVWASWDIDEYSGGATRQRLGEDPEYLRIGIVGLHGAFRG